MHEHVLTITSYAFERHSGRCEIHSFMTRINPGWRRQSRLHSTIGRQPMEQETRTTWRRLSNKVQRNLSKHDHYLNRVQRRQQWKPATWHRHIRFMSGNKKSSGPYSFKFTVFNIFFLSPLRDCLFYWFIVPLSDSLSPPPPSLSLSLKPLMLSHSMTLSQLAVESTTPVQH